MLRVRKAVTPISTHTHAHTLTLTSAQFCLLPITFYFFFVLLKAAICKKLSLISRPLTKLSVWGFAAWVGRNEKEKKRKNNFFHWAAPRRIVSIFKRKRNLKKKKIMNLKHSAKPISWTFSLLKWLWGRGGDVLLSSMSANIIFHFMFDNSTSCRLTDRQPRGRVFIHFILSNFIFLFYLYVQNFIPSKVFLSFFLSPLLRFESEAVTTAWLMVKVSASCCG